MGEQKRRKHAGFESSGSASGRGSAKRMRITWRTIGLFMLAMLMLDIVAYAVARFGFDSCYAVLCLLE